MQRKKLLQTRLISKSRKSNMKKMWDVSFDIAPLILDYFTTLRKLMHERT